MLDPKTSLELPTRPVNDQSLVSFTEVQSQAPPARANYFCATTCIRDEFELIAEASTSINRVVIPTSDNEYTSHTQHLSTTGFYTN
jgi:hypothetical protein